MKFKQWLKTDELAAAPGVNPASAMTGTDKESLEDQLAKAASGSDPSREMQQVLDKKKMEIDANAASGRTKVSDIAKLGVVKDTLDKQGVGKKMMKKGMKKGMKK